VKIGNLDIGKKILLAPMAELTDTPFRTIAKKYGAGLTFTQMVSAKGVIENNFDTLKLLAFSRDEKPIGVQILGNDPDIIGRAVVDISRYNPDVIDLNAGCPVPKVTSNNFGASIMEDTKLLGRLVSSMYKHSKNIPVSVKVRLGWNKNKISVVENAKAAEDNGASMIVVHTRMRDWRYNRQPAWEWLVKVKEAVNIPVIGNGSLFEPQDIHDIIAQTGCDSVMIARGALGNPFIFKRYNEFVETGIDPGMPGIGEIKDTVIEHINLSVKDSGENIGIKKIKKHIIWYFRNLKGTDEIIENIFAINSASELIDFVEQHCEKLQNGVFENYQSNYSDADFLHKVQYWLED
jgi:tRNA-dihydrouridine synthase B